MLGKYQTLYKKDIKEVGGLIAPDEEFRKAKGIRSVYVSNYGRVISKRVGKPRLLKSHFSNGYHSITVENGTKRKCYFVHILVAKAFVEVPEWINEDDYKKVKDICGADKEFLVVFPDGTGTYINGMGSTYRNEVTVNGIIQTRDDSDVAREAVAGVVGSS